MSLIYHYCSTDTLSNIIESKVLWFSDITKLKDEEEYKSGLSIIEEIVREICPDREKMLSEISIGMLSDEFKILTCSFSREQNQEYLWQEYGDGHKGAVIGFDENIFTLVSLTAAFINQKNPVQETVEIVDVFYDRECFKKVVRKHIHRWSAERAATRVLLLMGLMRLACLFKRPKYKDEQETRAFLEVTQKSKGHPVKTRQPESKKISYHEAPVNIGGATGIKMIILGLQNNLEKTRVEEALRENGFINVRVVKSEFSAD